MHTCAIHIMNALSAEGLTLFGPHFRLDADPTEAQGLLVRSSPVNLLDFPQLEAIARAGAGVNNIPVDEATEKGICVFNTPGANANAVVELLFTILGIWLRHVHQGMTFCQGLNGLAGSALHAEVEARHDLGEVVQIAARAAGDVVDEPALVEIGEDLLFFIQRHAMCDHIAIGRAPSGAHRLQKRGMEPPAMLVGAFHIDIGDAVFRPVRAVAQGKCVGGA